MRHCPRFLLCAVLLAGTAAPATAQEPEHFVDDPAADATGWGLVSAPVSEPRLDILHVDAAWDGMRRQFTLTMKVSDLSSGVILGGNETEHVIEFGYMKVPGTVVLSATENWTTDDRTFTASLLEAGGMRRLAHLAGELDVDADLVRFVVPAEVLERLPGAPKVLPGVQLSRPVVYTRRNVSTLDGGVYLRADRGSSNRVFTVS